MELELNQNNSETEMIVSELLQQNSNLRFELAVLRAALANKQREFEKDIESQMLQSQSLDSLPPEVIEMISKLDIR